MWERDCEHLHRRLIKFHIEHLHVFKLRSKKALFFSTIQRLCVCVCLRGVDAVADVSLHLIIKCITFCINVTSKVGERHLLFHTLILSFYFVLCCAVLYIVHNSNNGKDGLIADMLHIKRCTLQFYGLLFPISNFNLLFLLFSNGNNNSREETFIVSPLRAPHWLIALRI